VTRKNDEGEERVGELLRQIVLASVGAAALGKDELEEFLRKARERGDLAAVDVERLKERLTNVMRGSSGGWDEVVDAAIHASLRRLNIPRRSEIERLHRVIDELVKKIETLERR
jgi:polyhydroxyalkanoate synthesis regulator phasin